ncbi:hypothetical protein FQA47_006308 [Oryzias melastigma]|uniref:Uncharacterized protein n=1 Tax=Oryzias melastigma TaxID=30732 RepID=A0A834FQR8_ORYME|nr:hypothetical protein FQA47_006308 [Oryzias melastigma]
MDHIYSYDDSEIRSYDAPYAASPRRPSGRQHSCGPAPCLEEEEEEEEEEKEEEEEEEEDVDVAPGERSQKHTHEAHTGKRA